jgi:hypothetical protein
MTNWIRWISLTIFLICLLLVFFRNHLHGHWFEVELPTPEFMQGQKDIRDKDNREAFERVIKDDVKNEHDYEKASEYEKEHFA